MKLHTIDCGLILGLGGWKYTTCPINSLFTVTISPTAQALCPW